MIKVSPTKGGGGSKLKGEIIPPRELAKNFRERLEPELSRHGPLSMVTGAADKTTLETLHLYNTIVNTQTTS